MSYCRWSECDVYAYDSGEGVRFHIAGNQSLDRLCGTYNEAYQYAKELHDVHKLDVPRHALYALMEDAIEEAKQLKTENAELRTLCEDMLDYSRGAGFDNMAEWFRDRIDALGLVG